MPDAAGRFRGVSLAGVKNAWLESLGEVPRLQLADRTPGTPLPALEGSQPIECGLGACGYPISCKRWRGCIFNP